MAPEGDVARRMVRALFFGTPEIAVPSLEALRQVADVVGVVCQPDRRAGRGLSLRPPAVKVAALRLGLEVIQPETVRTAEFGSWAVSRGATVALVIAYGKILPQGVLDVPKCGCMNIHASVLPKYRGASPVTWAIVRGETETGVTLMKMDAGMDTGAILACERTAIGADETAGELSCRLGDLAAKMVRTDLLRAANGELSQVAQVDADATYAPLLKKADGLVDWSRSAKAIHDHVRGMNPWPGAFTRVGDKTLKVLRTLVCSTDSVGPPGTVLVADSGGIVVATGSGAIELLTLQFEGRNVLTSREVVAGRGLRVGDVLGSGSAVGQDGA